MKVGCLGKLPRNVKAAVCTQAELSTLSSWISMHRLEYSLTLPPAGNGRGAFSVILIGNQIAEYLRSPLILS